MTWFVISGVIWNIIQNNILVTSNHIAFQISFLRHSSSAVNLHVLEQSPFLCVYLIAVPYQLTCILALRNWSKETFRSWYFIFTTHFPTHIYDPRKSSRLEAMLNNFYWEWKTEVLGGNSVSVTPRPPHVLHGLTRKRTQAFTLRVHGSRYIMRYFTWMEIYREVLLVASLCVGVRMFHLHHHHHKHQGLEPLIRSVSRVTTDQSCPSSGDSELDGVSSGWITSPLTSFGGS